MNINHSLSATWKVNIPSQMSKYISADMSTSENICPWWIESSISWVCNIFFLPFLSHWKGLMSRDVVCSGLISLAQSITSNHFIVFSPKTLSLWPSCSFSLYKKTVDCRSVDQLVMGLTGRIHNTCYFRFIYYLLPNNFFDSLLMDVKMLPSVSPAHQVAALANKTRYITAKLKPPS